MVEQVGGQVTMRINEANDAAGVDILRRRLRIDRTILALSGDRARFFGTLTRRTPLSDGVNVAVGLRSSIDKSIALQWYCGSRVFVCDNLAFSAEAQITRKHTRFGIDRYQEAICKVVGELTDYREYEAYRMPRRTFPQLFHRYATKGCR